MPTLIIKPRHAKNHQFDSITNDPLLAAIKEQHPEIKAEKVFYDYIETSDKNQIPFDNSENGYNRSSLRQLKNHDKKAITVTFADC